MFPCRTLCIIHVFIFFHHTHLLCIYMMLKIIDTALLKGNIFLTKQKICLVCISIHIFKLQSSIFLPYFSWGAFCIEIYWMIFVPKSFISSTHYSQWSLFGFFHQKIFTYSISLLILSYFNENGGHLLFVSFWWNVLDLDVILMVVYFW